jgi:hypothetical protein
MPQRVARSAAVAACAVLALSLAGCSGSDDGVAASPWPTPTATPTPTVEIPEVPVPERPADEHTSDGAVAFTKYVVEVINRMYVTGDTESLMAISTTDCPACLRATEDIDKVYARGNRLRGGQMTLVDLQYAVVSKNVIPTVPSTVDFSALEEVTPDGEVVNSSPEESGQKLLWDLEWSDGVWRFADLRGAAE